jgi:hypothetical protein
LQQQKSSMRTWHHWPARKVLIAMWRTEAFIICLKRTVLFHPGCQFQTLKSGSNKKIVMLFRSHELQQPLVTVNHAQAVTWTRAGESCWTATFNALHQYRFTLTLLALIQSSTRTHHPPRCTSLQESGEIQNRALA